MSYDIHGNRLERGHCEVHPWVHQEYPCSVCMDENRRRDDERRHYEQMQKDQYAENERQYNEERRVVDTIVLPYLQKRVEIAESTMDYPADVVKELEQAIKHFTLTP